MELTNATVRALELPADLAEKTYFDSGLPGFGVRIRRGGSKTFVVQYKATSGKHRRMPLGAVGAIDLSRARRHAKDILAAVRLGKDPVAEKLAERERAAETFGALLPAFLARQRARLKPRSMVEVERALLIHAKPLHGHPIAGIDRRTVAVQLTKIAEQNGPGASNRLRANLSALFSWMLREGLVDGNPAANTNRQSEAGARTRVLLDAELKAIWHATADDQFGAIVKLLILTGCRRDEIGGLAWSEINLDDAVMVLPPERTKNRREHVVPLAPIAVEILKAQPRRKQADGEPRDLVFGIGQRGYSGWSKSQGELNGRLAEAGTPIENWWLHDIRRSVSTTMHDRLGVAPHIVEAVLGHVSGHKGGVAGVYNKADYEIPKRIALEKWADHVEALVTGKQSTAVVTKLRR